MQKGEILKEISLLLLNGNKASCLELLKKSYPFESVSSEQRKFKNWEKTKIFLEDGFIDRYSGDKLVFPGMLEIITKELTNDFPKHPNWKMSETHIAYWELYPTIDHIVPIARKGKDEPSNCVTTSMIHNAKKANFQLEKIGWEMKAKGRLQDWDGLTSLFEDLLKKNPVLLEQRIINDWATALKKAKASLLSEMSA